MPSIFRIGAALSVLVPLLAVGGPAAWAQDAAQDAAMAPEPDAVVARVGDAEITERDIEVAEEAFGSELTKVPEEQRRGVTIDAFVNLQLLAQAARDEGMDNTDEFAARVALLRLQALRNAYVAQNILGALTDEEVQDAYQKLIVAQHKPEKQVHARHILVDTKEEAEQIIADLKGGAAFEELAKKSKDPSGQNGGDLGFFGHGQMVKSFEDAAFALPPGKMTEEPVESRFGWHVIKVEETRMSPPPALEEVEAQLRNYITRQKFETIIAGLRNKYPVEIVGAPEATPEGDAMPAEESGEGSN